MKHTIFSLLIIFLISGHLFAQPGMNAQKRKEIKEMQLKYIINKLQLTNKEKNEFVPIYKNFTAEREKFFTEKHKTMRNFKQNSLNMSDQDLLNLADKFVNIDLQLAQLDKQYNEKFKKVLPPIKIILLYQAENEFKRELIKKMHHKQMKKMPPK
ncbi:MAG: hypothetical protein DRI94_05810 [Bacteroidetes bacterium]|nr:hypothetical protein [Bacteroidales bacterium]RLD51528.1 MAG: hypothetical protein DRI94_05810 [Bacteroidota bacterium]